jgi:hypothetical protein
VGVITNPEVKRLIQEASGEITRGAERLMALLDDFYKDRQIPASRRLILHFFPEWVRLQSQGAYIQERYPPDARERHRDEFREEMGAFTEFMKQEIFAEQR